MVAFVMFNASHFAGSTITSMLFSRPPSVFTEATPSMFSK